MRRLPRNSGLTLLELMIVVAIVGILAATAFPSYIRWLRRTYASEATLNLRKIFDSSVIYFGTAYGDVNGGLLPSAFPVGTPMKPGTLPTVRTVYTDDWLSVPTWLALHFNISDPHRYSYQYDSSGTENDAQFTASAHGDIDSDGIASTFVRFGSVHQMEVRGSGGIYEVSPME